MEDVDTEIGRNTVGKGAKKPVGIRTLILLVGVDYIRPRFPAWFSADLYPELLHFILYRNPI